MGKIKAWLEPSKKSCATMPTCDSAHPGPGHRPWPVRRVFGDTCRNRGALDHGRDTRRA